MGIAMIIGTMKKDFISHLLEKEAFGSGSQAFGLFHSFCDDCFDFDFDPEEPTAESFFNLYKKN